jgi:hypothetical protein
MWKNTISPIPNEITSLTNPALRQRAEKAWEAGHTILNAIYAWDDWVNLSRVSYSAGKPYSLDIGDAISRDGATAIRFLCSDQGASRYLFTDENSPALQNWPRPPSELLDLTYYVDWNPWDSMNPVTQAINGELLQLHNVLESEVRNILDDLAFSPTTALKQVDGDGVCTVLYLAANPATENGLALDVECREIEKKIRASEYRDSIRFISKWAVRPEDLIQYLNEFKPNIVHFSGHGSETWEIILQDDKRQPKPVGKDAILHLFSTMKDNIRLFFLNACFSHSQAEAISKVIDCTIGMRREISDNAAITFAARFYSALGFGRSVQEAFDQGIAALKLEEITEQDTPELLVRETIDPKELFLVKP